MSQHDYVIDNGSGAAVRADINSALQALASVNAGALEPATTYAYMLWADTTNSLLKMRNGANNAWVSLGDFTTPNLGHLTSYFPAGTKMIFYQAAPPTGWTKDTSHNDKALRVVSGPGGGSGGTHELSTPPSTAHKHTVSSHRHAASLAASVSGSITVDTSSIFGYYPTSGYAFNQPTGGGSFTASGAASGDTEYGGAGDTSITGPASFTPKYIDVIVAIKD
jgi:hypothetical protein